MKLPLVSFCLLLAAVQMANSQVVEQYQTRCPITDSWRLNQNCSQIELTSHGNASTGGKLLACTFGPGPTLPATVALVSAACVNTYVLEAMSRKMPEDVGNRVESIASAFNVWGFAVWTMNDWVFCNGNTWTNIPPAYTPC